MTPTPSVSDLRSLRLAVVGHQEWVTFLDVDALPQAGCISRASRSLEEPAGAGAVVAVQLARLSDRPVLFFTALGRDAIGERSVQRLKELGSNPLWPGVTAQAVGESALWILEETGRSP